MTFKSPSAYRDFSRSVRMNSRYIFEPGTQEFLETLIGQAKSKTVCLNANSTSLWRAQIGHEPDTDLEEKGYSGGPYAYSPERMKPLRGNAREGRANSKGLAVLYLATNKNTAMSEVRPWLSQGISVARFQLTKDLMLVDCTSHKELEPLIYLNPNEKLWNDLIWTDIDYAFSVPVVESENTSDYAPTQIISESIKAAGYDGVMYKSSVANGKNIALFDLDAAQVHTCQVFSANSIEYTFREEGNPYVVKRPKS